MSVSKGEDLQMEIFGLKCAFCSGSLETLKVINGTIHTRCSVCHHEARPNPKEIKNQVYSKFANKSVEVQYNRKAPPIPSKSGTFQRTHFESAGLRKCK